MNLQNIFNILILLILLIQFQQMRSYDRNLRALYYIVDTLQDILIKYFKEKEDEERDNL